MKKEWQHKLIQFQAEPPGFVWDKIASALDQDIPTEFADKLRAFETHPPAHIWERIRFSLEEEPAPAVIPFTKKYVRAIRYGSVAAILIAIAFFINLFTTKKLDSELSMPSTVGIQKTAPKIEERNSSTHTVQSATESPTDQVSLQPKTGKRFYNKQYASTLNKATLHIGLPKRATVVVDYHKPVVQSEIIDRYIVMADGGGSAIRLSKKLFDLFTCPDKKEDCQQNIQSVQQKIGNAPMMASADFTGLLDLLQNMDNQ